MFMVKKNKDYSRLTKSEIDRDYLDKIGIPKKVSVKRFQDRILPNIDYEYEIRGALGDKGRQKHCKVYDHKNIVGYINSLIEKKKNKH